MKFILPILVIILLIGVYLTISDQEQAAPEQTLTTKESSPLHDSFPVEERTLNTRPEPAALTETATPAESAKEEIAERAHIEPETQRAEFSENENQLIFNLNQSTHFLILGNADAENGTMNFKSELLPSNEVQLSIQLGQHGEDNIKLEAYFDLANFTMELDGGNSVLNKEHKKLLKETGEALQSAIWDQYAEYDIPEHALMLTQMLAYWSVSPEGFVHEKRVIVSQ